MVLEDTGTCSLYTEQMVSIEDPVLTKGENQSSNFDNLLLDILGDFFDSENKVVLSLYVLLGSKIYLSLLHLSISGQKLHI